MMVATWMKCIETALENKENYCDYAELLLKNEQLVQSTIKAFCDQMYNSVLRLPQNMREEFFYSIENLQGPAYEGLRERWKNESIC